MKPVLQAILVAEKVYSIEGGGKAIVNTIHSLTVPDRSTEGDDSDDAGKRLVKGGHAGPPWIYFSITDVCTGTILTLQFINLTRNVVIFEKMVTVKSANRLGTIEVALGLPDIVEYIEDQCVFAFEIVCEGEIIGSHRIRATVATEDTEK